MRSAGLIEAVEYGGRGIRTGAVLAAQALTPEFVRHLAEPRIVVAAVPMDGGNLGLNAAGGCDWHN